jgi:antitoxin component YwqK of YwqJK toxin-antitoxin module
MLLFLFIPLLLTAEPKYTKGIWPFKLNRYDKEGQFHGRWKLYLPDNTTLLRNGRYKHGKERGKWKYYYPNGTIRKIEYHKPHADRFLVRQFHENGKLEREGMARVVETERLIHYYWFGTWQVYDQQGQFTHTEYYEKGNEISLKLTAK